jgi:hypothetical protein
LYCVAVPEGVIRLKAAEVEFCCRNIEEAYQRRRAAIQIGDVEEHLRLAQWCQKQGLLSAAAAELADARKADPTHPLIKVLQHRLQIATEALPAQPARPADRSLSLEELNRTVRGLPPGSVETFTQTIQPLLMKNCSVGACHNPQSEKLRLLRTANSGPPSRRLTQQNLHEVLQFVDPKQPDASRLLTTPLQPHGTARAAVFNEFHAAQYKRLVDWVHAATGVPPAETPATVDRFAKPPLRAMPADGKSPESANPQPASTAEARASRKPHATQSPRKQYAREKPSPVQGGADAQPPAPADPTDPEVFNRRFFGPSDRASEGK